MRPSLIVTFRILGLRLAMVMAIEGCHAQDERQAANAPDADAVGTMSGSDGAVVHNEGDDASWDVSDGTVSAPVHASASDGAVLDDEPAPSGDAGPARGTTNEAAALANDAAGDPFVRIAPDAGAPGQVNGTSALPVVPGSGGVPQPSGGPANLTVLHWAGFKAAVTYTFDDSQASQIDHWADIRATQIAATYYLSTGNSGYPGYDATWREARSLGNELGNHTAHHCKFNLTGCIAGTPSAVAPEIDGCTDYAMNSLGAPAVWTMAYPFGDQGYAPQAKSRFFLARGTRDGLVAPGDGTDPFNLPIKAAVGGEAASVFDGSIDDARAQGKWMIFLFHTLLPDGQTAHTYADVDIASVTGSIAHVKSLADVWVDTLVAVGAYWLGEKTLLSSAPTASGAKTIWHWTLPAHFPPGRLLRVTVGGGTLTQGSGVLPWNSRGYYEVALDAGSLTWSP